MAHTTLVEIVNDACDELGLPRPGNVGVIASSVPQDRQMLALLNAAGKELVASHKWSGLITTANFTTAADTVVYDMPSDFDRIVDDAAWDRTNNMPMMGNITPQKQQFWLSSLVVAPTTRKEFRITLSPGASSFYLNPTPTSAETLSFLYVRNTWVASGSSNVAAFEADTDTTIFPPLLLVKELKWRWRSAKGLLATDLLVERNNFYDKCIAADVSSSAIDMAGPRDPGPFDYINIPDGNWNL